MDTTPPSTYTLVDAGLKAVLRILHVSPKNAYLKKPQIFDRAEVKSVIPEERHAILRPEDWCGPRWKRKVGHHVYAS